MIIQGDICRENEGNSIWIHSHPIGKEKVER